MNPRRRRPRRVSGALFPDFAMTEIIRPSSRPTKLRRRLLRRVAQNPELALDDRRCHKPDFCLDYLDHCDGKALEATTWTTCWSRRGSAWSWRSNPAIPTWSTGVWGRSPTPTSRSGRWRRPGRCWTATRRRQRPAAPAARATGYAGKATCWWRPTRRRKLATASTARSASCGATTPTVSAAYAFPAASPATSWGTGSAPWKTRPACSRRCRWRRRAAISWTRSRCWRSSCAAPGGTCPRRPAFRAGRACCISP